MDKYMDITIREGKEVDMPQLMALDNLSWNVSNSPAVTKWESETAYE